MSDSLLTTREAAKFLRVSEASIRRWADEGLLPAKRVGRRRARRFREDDLVRFMGPAERNPQAAPAGLPRAIAVAGMTIGLGSHLVSFYGTDGGRLRLGLPFLRDGIRAGQASILFAAPPVRDHYLKALENDGVDVDSAQDTGLLGFIPTRKMSVQQWLVIFDRLVADASRNHPGPMRFLGEAATGPRIVGSIKALLALEQQLAMIVKRLPMVMLCPYDVRRFDGTTLLESLRLHFDTFDYQFGYFVN